METIWQEKIVDYYAPRYYLINNFELGHIILFEDRFDINEWKNGMSIPMKIQSV